MRGLISALALTIAGLVSTVQAGTKCYAVAFGTGDMSSAFQAGVIDSLIKGAKTPEEVQYSVITGVAGSSVNAFLLASQPKGNEQAASDAMKKFWLDAGNTALYQDWWVGPWGALLGAKGLYDNSPLKTFIQKELAALNITSGSPLHRHLSIGLLDVLNGTYSEMDEAFLANNAIDTLFSSFSYPGFYPPNKAFGTEWFDGASVNSLDVLGAINKCRSQPGVESDSDIIVDVILSQSSNLTNVNATDYRTLGMLLRFIEIYAYYGSMNGLERARFSHPNITYRHVIAPSAYLSWNYLPLSLNNTQVEQYYNQGVLDGQRAVAQGLNMIDDHLDYYRLKKAGGTASTTKRVVSFEVFVAQKRTLPIVAEDRSLFLQSE